MPSVTYVPSQLGEGHFTDFQPPAAGATDNGKVWAWNSATSKFEPIAVSGGAPGGSNTHVQFNNGGAFAGDSGFTYAGSGVATLTGRLVVPVIRPASDSTTAVRIQSAGGTTIVTLDTTNKVFYFDSAKQLSVYSVPILKITGGGEEMIYASMDASTSLFRIRAPSNVNLFSFTVNASSVGFSSAQNFDFSVPANKEFRFLFGGSSVIRYLQVSGENRIGLYGVTPIARQLLATGTSATVDDVITVLQNIGIAKQS